MKQNPNPTLLIYDASAGSGKTYALVRHYLHTALNTNNPEKYQSILAITFTNKAAQEMKTRVLTQLREFSSAQILLEPTELFFRNCCFMRDNKANDTTTREENPISSSSALRPLFDYDY